MCRLCLLPRLRCYGTEGLNYSCSPDQLTSNGIRQWEVKRLLELRRELSLLVLLSSRRSGCLPPKLPTGSPSVAQGLSYWCNCYSHSSSCHPQLIPSSPAHFSGCGLGTQIPLVLCICWELRILASTETLGASWLFHSKWDLDLQDGKHFGKKRPSTQSHQARQQSHAN